MSDRQKIYYFTPANVTNGTAQGVQSGPRFTIARHNAAAARPIPASVGNLYPTLNQARIPNDQHGSNVSVLTAIVGIPPSVRQIVPGVTCIRPLVLPRPPGQLVTTVATYDGTVTTAPRANDVGIMLADRASSSADQSQPPRADLVSSSASMITARPSILRRKAPTSTASTFPFPQRRPAIAVETLQSQTAPATVVTVANDKLIYCVESPLSSAHISEKPEELQAGEGEIYPTSSERKRPRKQQLSEFSDRPERSAMEDKRGGANGRIAAANRALKVAKPVIVSSKADGAKAEENEKRTEEKKAARAEVQKTEGPARRRQLRLAFKDTKTSLGQNHCIFPEEAGVKFDPRCFTDEEIIHYCPIKDNVRRLSLIQDRIYRYSSHVLEVLNIVGKLREGFSALPKGSGVNAQMKGRFEKAYSRAAIACEMLGGALRNTMDNLSVLVCDYNLYHKPVEIDDNLPTDDEEEAESTDGDDQPGPSRSRR